jgi:hypothetical protein
MSQMSTIPVFTCKRCGRPVFVTHLSTSDADPELTRLREMMSNLKKITLCNDCRRAYNWYAMQGRTQDWEAGRP